MCGISITWTKRQCLVFFVLALTNLLTNMVYSIQAPIFPNEARKKNATATEYGFVFSIYELTLLCLSPVVGASAASIGILRVFAVGIILVGFSTAAFGFLQFIQGRVMFVAIAIGLRIIEGIGASAVYVAIYTFTATEFPTSIATTLGAMEGTVGLAFSIGPFVGSALFEIGGFLLPFNAIGGAVVVAGVLVYFVLRFGGYSDQRTDGADNSKDTTPGFFTLLQNVPAISFYMISVAVGAINIGFVQALLEGHLQQFNLRPIIVGLVFLLYGVSNAASAPIFSRLCGILQTPQLVPLTGSILQIIGFMLVGPAPFLPLKPSLGQTLTGLVLMGLAISCILSSGFILSMKAAENEGYSNASTISAQISGIWLASISLGAFVGPLLGGVLYDSFDFPTATLWMIDLDFLQAVSMLVFILWKGPTVNTKRTLSGTSDEKSQLILDETSR